MISLLYAGEHAVYGGVAQGNGDEVKRSHGEYKGDEMNGLEKKKL